MVLEVTNLSKKKLTLLSSDHYPTQGFSINSGAVVKIKKAVSRPSAVIFNAQDDGSKEPLYLNGLHKISVTPSLSPLQVVKLTVTGEGWYGHFWLSFHCFSFPHSILFHFSPFHFHPLYFFPLPSFNCVQSYSFMFICFHSFLSFSFYWQVHICKSICKPICKSKQVLINEGINNPNYTQCQQNSSDSCHQAGSPSHQGSYRVLNS